MARLLVGKVSILQDQLVTDRRPNAVNRLLVNVMEDTERMIMNQWRSVLRGIVTSKMFHLKASQWPAPARRWLMQKVAVRVTQGAAPDGARKASRHRVEDLTPAVVERLVGAAIHLLIDTHAAVAVTAEVVRGVAAVSLIQVPIAEL
jgi:hypothetical protein